MKKTAVLILCTLSFLCMNVFASSVKLSKNTVNQGGFFEITINDVQVADEIFTATFQKKKYQSARVETVHTRRIIVPVNVLAKTGESEIEIKGKYEIVIPLKITVAGSDFKESEKIQIVQPLSSKTLKVYEEEQKILEKIYHQTIENAFFTTIDKPSFAYPLKWEHEIYKVSSPFGFIRKRKIGVKSKVVEIIPHGGIDLAIPKGTTVVAVEDGVVRLARKLINSGNTIIIDHGYNVFSVYMHLSRIFVHKEDWVWKENEIAQSGDSGRVTGPHLHFGIKIWDTWVDPKYFVRELGGAQ